MRIKLNNKNTGFSSFKWMDGGNDGLLKEGPKRLTHPAFDWPLSCVSMSSCRALFSLASRALIKYSTRQTLKTSAAGPTM